MIMSKKVETFLKLPETLKQKVDIFYEQASKSNSKLASNYTKDKLKENVWATSVILENNQVVGVASVLHRDIYGNNARIMNRYFYRPESYPGLMPELYAGINTRQTSIDMIDQQTDIAYSLGFSGVFVSQGRPKNVILKRMCAAHNNHSKYKWTMDEKNKYLVHRAAHNDKSWQWIFYNGELELKSRPAV